jgi:outer membrane protein assembly factor BamB
VDGATGALVWKFPAPDAVFCVAPIGDVNGNGRADVLVGTGDNSHNAYCIDGGGIGVATSIWSFYVGDTSYSVAAIPDINGDDIDDALVGSWDSAGNVHCLNGATGIPIWSHPTGAWNAIMRVIPIEDLNDDGKMEVLVASWDNAIICLDGATGNEHWNVPTGTINGGDVWAIWPLGDVDNDGYADVIAGSFDLKAYCISGRTGLLMWEYTVGNRVYTVRGISDVNGDTVDDAVVGVQSSGIVFCLDPNGEPSAVPPLGDVACRLVDDDVLVSWSFGAGEGFVGFNVYRSESGESGSPATARRMLAGRGVDTVPEMLAMRAGVGARGEPKRLNDELISEARYVDRSAIDGASYWYMVGAVRRDGSEIFAGPVEILAELPSTRIWLSPGTPNPFSRETTVEFAAPAGCTVGLGVYDLQGRLVRELHLGTSAGGSVSMRWDGVSGDGHRAASGVYLMRLSAGGEIFSRKIVLMR